MTETTLPAADATGLPAGRAADTRERILDAAELLFSSDGIDATSLRSITRTADVNLAAVHYHFGSKHALLDAVVERRAAPVSAAQAAALDALDRESAARPGATAVHDIVHAFLGPIAEIHRGTTRGPILAALLSRLQAQPPEAVETIFRTHFGDILRRFVEALQCALPNHPHDVVADRFRLAVGVVTHVFSGVFALDTIPGHPSRQGDADEGSALYAEVVAFLVAGLAAPHPASSSLQSDGGGSFVDQTASPSARNDQTAEKAPGDPAASRNGTGTHPCDIIDRTPAPGPPPAERPATQSPPSQRQESRK